MVTEVNCNQEDCVPIETLVIILLHLQPSSKHTTTDTDTDDDKETKAASLDAPFSGGDAAGVKSNDVAPDGSSSITSSGGKGGRRWVGKILKPMKEVQEEDVAALDLPGALAEWSQPPLATATSTSAAAFTAPSASATTPGSSAAEGTPAVTVVRMKPRNAVSSSIAVAPPPLPPIAPAPTATYPLYRREEEKNKSQSAVNYSSALSNAPSASSGGTGPTSATGALSISHSETSSSSGSSGVSSHYDRKGGGSSRPRGCPCCDPDNLENIVDRIIFSQLPP